MKACGWAALCWGRLVDGPAIGMTLVGVVAGKGVNW